jgi:preprotein translocase subunit SecG
MKSKSILVLFLALFFVVFALNMVAADIVDVTEVRVNDVVAHEVTPTVAGEVSDIVPIDVEFTANEDVEDVRVKVYIEGYKSEISETTSRFHIVEDSKYIKRFSLRLPSSIDLDDLTEGLDLYVRVSAKGEDAVEKTYAIKMQRGLYSLNALSVDGPRAVKAGEQVALDVVVENNGHEDLENVYIKASIPELDIERRVYVGDLSPMDECEDDEDSDCDRVDAISRRVYLSIPRNAVAGDYEVQIEVYNYDTSSVVTRNLLVEEVESGVLPGTTARTIAVGEETTFDVILVNPNDRLVVYSITPEESPGLIIEVTEPIVTVSADSSRTVKVKVKATEDAEEGTHLVTVNVNSENGMSKQTSFTLNVDGKGQKETADAVLVLTIILVIIFVVLLIVLIVLLTRRSEESEEFGETSYY